MKQQLAAMMGLGMLAFASAAQAWESFEGEGQEEPAQSTESWSAPAATRPEQRVYGVFDLGIPLAMNVDRELVRPGVDLHGEAGLDLGWFAFFVNGGYRWLPLDYGRAAEHGNHSVDRGTGRAPLTNPYVGFGPRFQLPNRTRLLPYISGSVDFNFWGLHQTDAPCVAGSHQWYCDSYKGYRFTPGFSGRVGTGIGLLTGIYLDVGLSASMSFANSLFDHDMSWLTPYLGVKRVF